MDNPTNDPETFTMNPDGTSLTHLTKTSLSDNKPAFSPDGTKVAYSRDQPGIFGSEVLVIDANYSNETNITDSSLVFDGTVDRGAQPVSPPQFPKHKNKRH